MDWETIGEPSFTAIELLLSPGESVTTESGAMSWMEGELALSTNMKGGASLKRKVLTGESFFQNTYTAGASGGKIGLVHGCPGDIVGLEMDGTPIHIERGGYIASTGQVSINSKFDGLSGLFKEGLFVLRAEGQGTLFFGSYGAIDLVEVDGSYIVDNGHAVAWDASLAHHLTSTGKKIRSFLFGDQLVMRFSGKGRLWVQSRNPRSFAAFLHPFRRVKSQNNN